MRIVFLDAYTTNPGDLDWADLRKLGDLDTYDSTPSDLIVERSISADIVITNKCLLTADVLEQLPHLQLICVAATGYNNIDVEAARARGVSVANVSGYSTDSVVQHVFAMLLSHLNSPSYYSHGVRKGRWSRSTHFAYTDDTIRSVSGLTMGIIGYGCIGQAVARVALALGMSVIAHRRSDVPSPVVGVEMVSLEAVLGAADVVSLHAPATTATTGMIDEAALRLMKQDAILINTARGALIAEDALVDWLRQCRRAVALLDVLAEEPPPAHHPLFSLDNAVITPHQAWIADRSRQCLLKGIEDNIISFNAGTLVSL